MNPSMHPTSGKVGSPVALHHISPEGPTPSQSSSYFELGLSVAKQGMGHAAQLTGGSLQVGGVFLGLAGMAAVGGGVALRGLANVSDFGNISEKDPVVAAESKSGAQFARDMGLIGAVGGTLAMAMSQGLIKAGSALTEKGKDWV